MSRGPGRPPAAKAAETRQRILRAAREVFSERGYGAATFQAIAVRADLTRPAINHYFANKRVLYWVVLEETTHVVVGASAQRARRETTLAGRVSAFIEGTIEAMHRLGLQLKAGEGPIKTIVVDSVHAPSEN